jgi:hypothetical protein
VARLLHIAGEQGVLMASLQEMTQDRLDLQAQNESLLLQMKEYYANSPYREVRVR